MEKDEAEKKRDKNILDHEGRIRELSDSMKQNNICIIGVPEEEREERAKCVLEQIIAENFPTLWKETDIENPGGTENSLQNQQKGQHHNVS